MPTSSCPSVRLEPPMTTMGQGEGDAEGALHPPGLQGQVPQGREMPLPPLRPGRHPVRPSRIRLPGDEGDHGQGGGSRWAVPESWRDSMGTTTSRTACPAPELASLSPPAVHPERREASVRSLPAPLGARPRPVPRADSLSCSGACTRDRGANRCRVWCRTSGDQA